MFILATDYDNPRFVKVIAAVARGIHKTPPAECVANEEKPVILRGFDADCVQGYYLEMPRAERELRFT